MLISFSLENWMSFKNKVSFSLIATRERPHGARCTRLGKYQTRILPFSIMYGGNASGKTNFCKAICFCKMLVVRGRLPDTVIPREPFRLSADDVSINAPSRFCFELLIHGTIYEFSFAVTNTLVLEEKLVAITSTRERVLYHRHAGAPNFDPSLSNDTFLHFVFTGTRDNQLFLTNAISQKVEIFRPVYDWFKNTLTLVAPDTRFAAFWHFVNVEQLRHSRTNEMLEKLDTGVTHLGYEKIPWENLPLSPHLKTQLREELVDGMTARLSDQTNHERYLVTREGDELHTVKLVTYHPKDDGTEIPFNLSQESDGFRRILDLLPVVLDLIDPTSQKVYVIDDLTQHLHTQLTRSLLEMYLANRTARSRAQLLMTSHDVLLMDQELLRRDEIWVCERDAWGASTLTSFCEYEDVRNDQDIRKSYLQGRLGGIPRICIEGILHSTRSIEEQGNT